MLHRNVTDELILPIVTYGTFGACVRLLFVVSSFMVISVADRREHAGADTTFVRSIAGVDAHMNLKVAAFVENLSTENVLTLMVLMSNMVADKCSPLASS